MASRNYPVILSSYIQLGRGTLSEAQNVKTIFSDSEYESYIKIADRRSLQVKETKHPDVVAQELAEAIEAAEMAGLSKRKLILDVDAAERFQKSYPFTKWSARIAITISVILVIIEILKDTGVIHAAK